MKVPRFVKNAFPSKVHNEQFIYGDETKFFMGHYWEDKTHRNRYFIVAYNIWESVPRCEEVYK